MPTALPILMQWLMAEGGAAGGGLADLLIPLVVVFLIFYFLVIRPASKERRTREAQVRNLQKHDKVVTNAGIHGTVVGFDDETVTLRVDDKNNVRMRFSRAAIWQVSSSSGAPKGSDEAKKTHAGSK